MCSRVPGSGIGLDEVLPLLWFTGVEELEKASCVCKRSQEGSIQISAAWPSQAVVPAKSTNFVDLPGPSTRVTETNLPMRSLSLSKMRTYCIC